MAGVTRKLLSILAVAGCVTGCGGSSGSSSKLQPGSYRGQVICSGADRFSTGARTVSYHSTPAASVVVGSSGALTRWTYFFLGRPDLVLKPAAVSPGQSFAYGAGKHIGHPGRTQVTVADASRSATEDRMTAKLEWSSPDGYLGAGTYTLLVEARTAKRVRYHAQKVVLKLPSPRAKARGPVVRRNETCVGDLSR